MGFFRRIFSADYRAAIAAEAAGDLDLAAERYALAGHREAAASMHVARAGRAGTLADRIAALRDALHWAPPGTDARKEAARTLGEALLARCRAEGIATERDREQVREAARLLEEAGDGGAAGDAFELIGDDHEAARSYARDGLVDRMEAALAREQARADRERRRHEGFADYQTHMRGGDRDAARAALRECVEATDDAAEYRRLLDQLESRIIAGGRVSLRRRGGNTVVFSSGPRILLGRDPLCDLVLRSGGVSRQHAAVDIGPAAGGADAEFLLRDVESRNGTRVGGLPLAGEVPLRERGSFALGDDCEIEFVAEKSPPRLTLRVARGVDQGALLRAAPEGTAMTVDADKDGGGPLLVLRFKGGRPLVEPPRPGADLRLNGEPVVRGSAQLVHGDELCAAGTDFEVL